MIGITRFKPDKHFEVLVSMHKAQEYLVMHAIQETTLPKIGFITYSNTEYQYVAAGFLRMVEGGFAQIDTLVTNPEVDPHVRNEAINLLVEKLLETAKSLELKSIYAITSVESVLMRAEAAGFHVINQSIIAKLL